MRTLCFSILVLGMGGAASAGAGESLDRSGFLWAPYLEWRLENPGHSGNPFELEATVTFTHAASGEARTTGMFYDRDHAWKFRFTGTRSGVWTFVTRSPAPALDAQRGTVRIAATPAGAPHGFITTVDGNRWAWQTGEDGQVTPFVPQLAMGRELTAYRDRPEKIDEDIRIWLVEHGFNGLHVGVLGRWFDVDRASHDQIQSPDPNPDPRTFEILEPLIARVHRAGGMVHLWMWGDEQRRMTPVKWGINGAVDQRLQRYLAARLGPLPGWTLGYGFDLWEWVNGPQLANWHDSLHRHLGWPHLLGGRWQQNRLTQATEVLDYAGYEQHRPTYQSYVDAIERRPGKPAFSEDRFRVRDPSPYPDKDYDLEMTRRGLWHSTLAGGVANIWGYLVPSDHEGGSRPYPNRDQIQTYARFFQHRFLRGLERANQLTDGVALVRQSPLPQLFLFYKEDADAIRLNLATLNGAQPAVAVDTRKPYAEIDLGRLEPADQTWAAPYRSDWAVAVGAPRSHGMLRP